MRTTTGTSGPTIEASVATARAALRRFHDCMDSLIERARFDDGEQGARGLAADSQEWVVDVVDPVIQALERAAPVLAALPGSRAMAIEKLELAARMLNDLTDRLKAQFPMDGEA